MSGRINSLQLLATYNKVMNVQIYEATSRLSFEELSFDRQAFFGSILGTLNHLVVGDTIWLKRFAQQEPHHLYLQAIAQLEMPTALNQILFADLSLLSERRKMLDEAIILWMGHLHDYDLDGSLSYTNTKGVHATKAVSEVLLHFFNHQTHHRGQLSTLLFQAGVDVGTTDLITFIPDQEV